MIVSPGIPQFVGAAFDMVLMVLGMRGLSLGRCLGRCLGLCLGLGLPGRGEASGMMVVVTIIALVVG